MDTVILISIPNMAYQNSPAPKLVSSSVVTGFDVIDHPIKQLRVNAAYYRKLSKQDAPSLLVAIYHCERAKVIREVIPFEHCGELRTIAANWWSLRSDMPVPKTVDSALINAVHIRVPIALRIRANTLSRKYPVILEAMFRSTTIN